MPEINPMFFTLALVGAGFLILLMIERLSVFDGTPSVM